MATAIASSDLLIATADATPTLTADAITYRVAIENPGDKPIAICLMHFSVVSAPLLMFSLSATSGLVEPRLPEIYPVADEKVPFETLTLPARTRLAVEATRPIARKSYAAAKDLKLSRSIILNHEYRGGSIAIHP